MSPCVVGVSGVHKRKEPIEEITVFEFTRNRPRICEGCLVVALIPKKLDSETVNVLAKLRLGKCTRPEFFS
jgi:hypothetical protein